MHNSFPDKLNYDFIIFKESPWYAVSMNALLFMTIITAPNVHTDVGVVFLFPFYTDYGVRKLMLMHTWLILYLIIYVSS